MSKSGTTATYSYNQDGIRASKTVNGVTTTYTLVGDRVTHETNGTDSIYYRYDSAGSLISMNLNGTEYYYFRNAQGDIIGLVDYNGNVVVEYTYDAWGKILTVTGTLAGTLGVKNPYRYRGYRFDTESGLYYLQSRYYNPQWGRFVNADDTSVLSAQKELTGANLFTYCLNNPVMRTDEGGYLSNWFKIGIGALAIAGALVLTALTGGAAAPLLVGVAVSVVSSAAIGGVVGYANGGVDGMKQGMIDGACDGFMWGGIGAFGGSAIRAVKIVNAANKGIVIGKSGAFEQVAKKMGCDYYKGLKGFKTISKINANLANKIGWAQNKSFVKGVMKLNGGIFDIGGELTGSYAKEVILTSGYKNISYIGGVF